MHDKKDTGLFMKEIELLCQLRHPNLICLIGFCNHKCEKIIVYEYMPNGPLSDHLYNQEMEPLSWKKRLDICVGVARGLHYLHSGAKRTIIHRDIKPDNILLDSDMVPKISGFDISLQGPLFKSKPKPIKTKIAGTMGLLAPDNFSHTFGGLTDRSDVYYFGAVLLNVICANPYVEILVEMREVLSEQLETRICLADPLQRLRAGEIIDPVLVGKIAPECLEVYVDIIGSCLKYNPNKRPTMGEVEVLLELALSLQEEADIRKTKGDHYNLFSTTIRRHT